MKWMLTLFAILLFFACSKTPDPVQVKLQGDKNKETNAYAYKGGLFKVWVTLKEPVATEADVRWKTGKGDIAERFSVGGEGAIESDTVYLHWETLPKVTVEIETTLVKEEGDSVGTEVYDTAYHYFDTISVVISGEEHEVGVVEIFNILPKIDSLLIGGIPQPGDSTLTLAVHPGERMEVEMRFSDAFNTNYPVQSVQWPEGMGTFEQKSRNDSVWVWIWNAPNALMDTVLPLIIADKGGYGDRRYRLQLVIYDEAGSAWVVSGTDLVKFSPQGNEVARIAGKFKDVSDLVINSNSTITNKLWVVDIAQDMLARYDAYGRPERIDTGSFDSPFSVAVDVETRLVWVSQWGSTSGDTLFSKVQRYTLGDSGLTIFGSSYTIPGPVKGLSVDQFEQAVAWFVSPEEDFVGYIRSGSASARIFQGATYRFNRPSQVSWDAVSGRAWISDSSRVVVLDTAGTIVASITGFQFANSLSAGGGVCWVSDILRGSVYQFPMSLTGTRTVGDGLRVDGFISPASVSTYTADQGVWVSDKAAGEVVRLNGSGARIASGTGLTLPTLIRAHQVIE